MYIYIYAYIYISQPSGKKRLEGLPNQFHNRSTRLPTHQPVPYETRVARGKELKHAGSHTKQNGSKNPLYVGYDSQVFLYRTKLQDRLDTPRQTGHSFLLKSEHIGASFSTKRQTDGLMKVEWTSTMYDGMGLAYSLLSRGLREESNTGAP